MNDQLIQQAMLADQHWLRQQARKIRELKQASKPSDQLQTRFTTRLQDSVKRRHERTAACPPVEFNSDLPILQHREEIVEALIQNQVIVVAGETGSGKSTQLPKICLSAGYGISGFIGHTQPRRIAARSVAQRIAEELNTPLGQAVGYKIRFQDKTNLQTYVKLMTDGILLAEAANDRFLENYEVIILDEAHERSLNIDFLLGTLHRLLQRRPELRLIVTSATIDAERFGDHFGTSNAPAPVINVEGRTYPVEVRHRNLEDEEGKSITPFQGIVQATHELASEGDILVFLPTERDIRETAKRLRADSVMQHQRREILPLYARLSTAEQNKIFKPTAARRIVLATNVAESSLTVPRIHCVIDTGTARISRFSSRLRMQRLPIEPVSQASADQRKGRCGRLGPGICIRLYDEADFLARPSFTTPEIRRTNLASVILQAKYLKLGELDTIAFLDAPRPEAIREGYRTLFEIGAVDEQRDLTKVGRTLAQLPVDPRIGRMVLAAHDENCLAEVLIIAAALEVQDPRVRPVDKQQVADERHAPFTNQESDFLSFLHLWDFIEAKRDELSRSKFHKTCEQSFLSPNRIREWSEIHRQLRQTAQEHGMKPKRRRDDSAAIHRALLQGLLGFAAFRDDEREYTGAGGNKFFLWPGSGLYAAKPKWIVAAELVETSKRFGRTVAKIDPGWLEQLGEHLTKRSYSDAHWHLKSQSVMAYEKLTLFGLPIVARRRVPYGHLDPETSRRVFIEKGLVARQMEVSDKFFRNNGEVIETAEALAAKTRKREFILDEFRIHAFYEEHIPSDVYDLSSLRRRIKEIPELEQQLCMSVDDLIGEEATLDPAQFPPQLDVGSMQLPLSYHFEPGADVDGVTVTAPAEVVSQLHAEQLEWLVPGLLEEKLIALIRALPKTIRRGLVPAPDTAQAVAANIEFGKRAFLPEICRHFSEIAGERITPDLFRLEKIAPHLRMRVQVVDAEGQELTADRDLQALQSQTNTASSNTAPTDSDWHRDGITSWDFGDIPSEVRVPRGGIEVVQFPALVEFEDRTLGLRLEETQTAAEVATRTGTRRLYREINRRTLRSQVRNLPHWEEIVLWSATLFPRDTLEDQLALLIAEVAFLHTDGTPKTQAEFERRQSESAGRITAATQTIGKKVHKLMEAYHQARLALADVPTSRFADTLADIEQQLLCMLHQDFLSDTPWSWLAEFPRYLAAIGHRIQKLGSSSASSEATTIRNLQQFWSRIDNCDPESNFIDRNALVEYRWMIEEYRVSLFAQQLGTRVKVSPQRLEKQWAKTSTR